MQKETEQFKKNSYLADGAATAKSVAADMGNAGDSVKQFGSQLIDELGDFLESKKDSVVGMKCKYKNHIKENPFIAVIGALAVGALLGAIFKK